MQGMKRKRHDGIEGQQDLRRRARRVESLREVEYLPIPSMSIIGLIRLVSLLHPPLTFSPSLPFLSACRAGSAVVLHKDSPRQERWNKLKETNPILRRFVSLREQYDESENPVISSIRSVTSTIGSWFDETEFAQVMRQMRLMDPTFDRESFERELREYIVPEVVDAYLSADRVSLQKWCGEAVRV